VSRPFPSYEKKISTPDHRPAMHLVHFLLSVFPAARPLFLAGKKLASTSERMARHRSFGPSAWFHPLRPMRFHTNRIAGLIQCRSCQIRFPTNGAALLRFGDLAGPASHIVTPLTARWYDMALAEVGCGYLSGRTFHQASTLSTQRIL